MGRIIAAVLVLLFLGCERPENWSGTFYPDRSDLSQFQHFDGYTSLGDCRDAMYAVARNRGLDGWDWDYLCGVDCRPFYENTVICRRTAK